MQQLQQHQKKNALKYLKCDIYLVVKIKKHFKAINVFVDFNKFLHYFFLK